MKLKYLEITNQSLKELLYEKNSFEKIKIKTKTNHTVSKLKIKEAKLKKKQHLFQFS